VTILSFHWSAGDQTVSGRRLVHPDGARFTVGVGSEVADFEPKEFVAVTVILSVEPTSLAVGVYVAFVAAGIATQL
jgi:hypothetical protein